MLTVDYKKKLGKMVYDEYETTLYASNALMTEIYENCDGDRQLAGFYADCDHMKRCLGITKGYHQTSCNKVREMTLYSDMIPEKDLIDIVKAYATATDAIITICKSTKQ